MAPICGIITLTEESIKTQKATNRPNLITQSEEPPQKEIMVLTYLSVLSGVTGATVASVTPENASQERKEKSNHLQRRQQ